MTVTTICTVYGVKVSREWVTENIPKMKEAPNADFVMDYYREFNCEELKSHPGLFFYTIPHDQQDEDESGDDEEYEVRDDVIIGCLLHTVIVFPTKFKGKSINTLVPDIGTVVKNVDKYITKYEVPGDVLLYDIQNDCGCCS